MGKRQANGYVQEYVGIDPKTGKEIWTYKHRKEAGVGVGDKRIVHHKSGNKADSSKDNLQVVKDRGQHNKIDPALHRGGRKKGK